MAIDTGGAGPDEGDADDEGSAVRLAITAIVFLASIGLGLLLVMVVAGAFTRDPPDVPAIQLVATTTTTSATTTTTTTSTTTTTPTTTTTATTTPAIDGDG